MKLKDLIRKLEAGGFYMSRQSGHMIYSNTTGAWVAVPRHVFLNGKTAHHILKRAGLK